MEKIVAELKSVIVEAGTNPPLWEALLPTFAKSFPGLKSTIHFEDPVGSPHRTAFVEGIDHAAVETYGAHFGALNPWNPFWATAAPFHAHVSDDVAPAEAYSDTEFYNDWLRPLGEASSAVGMKILTEGPGFGAISLHFGPRLAGSYNRSLAHVVQEIAGDMRNALALNRRMLRSAPLPASLEVVIEAIDEPAFLLDLSGRLRLQNALAEAMVRRQALARLDQGGRLELADQDAGRKLTETLGKAAHPGIRGAGTTPAIWVLRSGSGDVEGFVKVLMLSVSEGALRGSAYMFPPSRFALVTVYPRTRQAAGIGSLQGAFGLTAAESRLAMRLRSGESLSEIADASGVSRQTVRQHLKSIFLKTGTNRQAELVLLLSRLP